MREGQSTKEIKFWPPSRKDREVKATTAGKPGNAKLLHQGRPTRVSHYIRERYYTKEGREIPSNTAEKAGKDQAATKGKVGKAKSLQQGRHGRPVNTA